MLDMKQIYFLILNQGKVRVIHEKPKMYTCAQSSFSIELSHGCFSSVSRRSTLFRLFWAAKQTIFPDLSFNLFFLS